jgi:hypothetical protein
MHLVSCISFTEHVPCIFLFKSIVDQTWANATKNESTKTRPTVRSLCILLHKVLRQMVKDSEINKIEKKDLLHVNIYLFLVFYSVLCIVPMILCVDYCGWTDTICLKTRVNIQGVPVKSPETLTRAEVR